MRKNENIISGSLVIDLDYMIEDSTVKSIERHSEKTKSSLHGERVKVNRQRYGISKLMKEQRKETLKPKKSDKNTFYVCAICLKVSKNSFCNSFKTYRCISSTN